MKTIYDLLWALRLRILETNKYFNDGYHYARFMGPDQMVVAVAGESEFKYVGIQDVKGNYFYIRVNDVITTRPAPASSDCGVTVTETYPCALVAVVTDADPLILKDALLNAILHTGARVKTQNISPEVIIASEFSRLSEPIRNRAISSVGRRTIVKIEFDMDRAFEKTTCIFQPCKYCSG